MEQSVMKAALVVLLGPLAARSIQQSLCRFE
jgi:hypothetical protein